jgi:hypothetical protein
MKDLVEERLFERRRDLFSELSVVFMDTTSLYFKGAGGETPDEGPARFYLRLLDDYRCHGPPEQEPTVVQLALK